MIRKILCAAIIAGAGAAAAEPSIERGEYLVTGPAGCGNCHSDLGPQGFIPGRELSGRLVLQDATMTAYAPNITPASRIAGWSDAELARAIREGIRPDGSLIGPPMPFSMYRDWGDEDLASMVMYLRTVPAVENTVPASQYAFPLPPAWGPPVTGVTPPPPAVTVEYGRYLATAVAHCMECHTPFGPQGPMLDKLGQGGFEFTGPWGMSVAANLTPVGIGKISDADLKVMITQGKRPDGSAMLPPMPYPFLAKMTPEDLDAVILFLRSLPPGG